MTSILGVARSCGQATVQLLNQPAVKEGAKNIFGIVSFVFGAAVICEDVQRFQKARNISSESKKDTEQPNTTPTPYQTAERIAALCSKISLIFSALVSRPGAKIISTLAGCVASTSTWERLLGPNTIFAVNPWHLRHIVSIAATVLAFPLAALSVYQGVTWACKKLSFSAESPPPAATPPVDHTWLSDTKVRLMNLFTLATSRTTLHIGNQLASRLVA